MNGPAFTHSFDVAELALYAFFLFFAGLVFYLRREDKREGYPLDSDRSRLAPRIKVQGWPTIPKAKKYLLAHEPEAREFPRAERDLKGILAPAAGFPGAPMVPLGDPMRDGVGAASYAERLDVPDVTFDEQLPKIVPLRVANGYYLAEEEPDPRGMEVVTFDGDVVGRVVDVWVDRSETFVRYIEVETTGEARRVLVPSMLIRMDPEARRIRVQSVTGPQLRTAPVPKNPDQITLKEEDRIAGYFAGGHIYATPQRLGPLL